MSKCSGEALCIATINGFVVIGGLNPVAVPEGHCLATESEVTSTLFGYSRLVPFTEFMRDYARYTPFGE